MSSFLHLCWSSVLLSVFLSVSFILTTRLFSHLQSKYSVSSVINERMKVESSKHHESSTRLHIEALSCVFGDVAAGDSPGTWAPSLACCLRSTTGSDLQPSEEKQESFTEVTWKSEKTLHENHKHVTANPWYLQLKYTLYYIIYTHIYM